MKKLAGMIILSVFFIVGCQDDNSILSPTDDLHVESNSPKGRIIVPKYITLPDDGVLAKIGNESGYWSVTTKVDDDDDFNLIIEEKYEGGIYGAVKVYANLSIQEETVKEGYYVTMDIGQDHGIISFGPSALFGSYAELDVMFVGIDLREVLDGNIAFARLYEDGSAEEVKYQGIKVDKTSGTLYLVGAIVYSGAEYGWVITE